MEVHHHAPSSRKKWTHYFWEFLMLFLAVFCGFLAENFRENRVENHRAEQYMRSLAEDLENDTAALQIALTRADSIARYSDSTVLFLAAYTPTDKIPEKLAALITVSGSRLDMINSDRTTSQLKNSGGMRLIRKKNVSDEILWYWEQIEQSRIALDRYRIYRDAGRELLFKLWVIPQVYQITDTQSAIRAYLKVIDPDPKKWAELMNLVAISGQICKKSVYLNFEKQYSQAKNLILLIKKEYHIK